MTRVHSYLMVTAAVSCFSWISGLLKCFMSDQPFMLHNLINTMTAYDYFFPRKKIKIKKPSYVSFFLFIRHCFGRLQQPYLEWKHFLQQSKKTWLMSILSLAMQLQRSPNHSQEDVHVDTCYGPMIQLLCPIHNVLWIISCVCKVLIVLFL